MPSVTGEYIDCTAVTICRQTLHSATCCASIKIPIRIVLSAVNVVVAIFERKYTADSFSFTKAFLILVNLIPMPLFFISQKTRTTATIEPIISRTGIHIISESFFTKTNVRTVAISRIVTYRIVMTCISSIPLNKKSIRKQVNATTTNERIV